MQLCTDISQSKALAYILPLESADMVWSRCTITDFDDGVLKVSYAVEPCNISQFRNTKEDIPCWSLAALLYVMPSEIDDNYFLTLEKEGKEYCCCYQDINGNSFRHEFADNPVDACVEMILKLHKEGLL